MAKSVALNRKISAYPSSINHRLLIAESKIGDISVSSIVYDALKKHYENMSEDKKRQILEGLK
jgi:hypothetical protein